MSDKKTTVLVVDDNPGILDLVGKMLKCEGFAVITANDGEEGLEKFKKYQNTINFLVTDNMMPKMRGPQLFIKIQEIKPTPGILISSAILKEDVGRFQRIGFVTALSKVFELNQISAIIKKTLGI